MIRVYLKIGNHLHYTIFGTWVLNCKHDPKKIESKD